MQIFNATTYHASARSDLTVRDIRLSLHKEPLPFMEARTMRDQALAALLERIQSVDNPVTRDALTDSLGHCVAELDDATQQLDALVRRESQRAGSLTRIQHPADDSYAQATARCVEASRSLLALSALVPDAKPEAGPPTSFAAAAVLLLLAVAAIAASGFVLNDNGGFLDGHAAQLTGGAAGIATIIGVAGLANAYKGNRAKAELAANLGALVTHGFGIFDKRAPALVGAFAQEFSAKLMQCDTPTVHAWLGCAASGPGQHAYPMLKAAITGREDRALHRDALTLAVSHSQLDDMQKQELINLILTEGPATADAPGPQPSAPLLDEKQTDAAQLEAQQDVRRAFLMTSGPRERHASTRSLRQSAAPAAIEPSPTDPSAADMADAPLEHVRHDEPPAPIHPFQRDLLIAKGKLKPPREGGEKVHALLAQIRAGLRNLKSPTRAGGEAVAPTETEAQAILRLLRQVPTAELSGKSGSIRREIAALREAGAAGEADWAEIDRILDEMDGPGMSPQPAARAARKPVGLDELDGLLADFADPSVAPQSRPEAEDASPFDDVLSMLPPQRRTAVDTEEEAVDLGGLDDALRMLEEQQRLLRQDAADARQAASPPRPMHGNGALDDAERALSAVMGDLGAVPRSRPD